MRPRGAASATGPIQIWYSNNGQEVQWGEAMVAAWNKDHPNEQVTGQQIRSAHLRDFEYVGLVGAPVTLPGDVTVWDWEAYPITDAEGTHGHLLVVGIDATERALQGSGVSPSDRERAAEMRERASGVLRILEGEARLLVPCRDRGLDRGAAPARGVQGASPLNRSPPGPLCRRRLSNGLRRIPLKQRAAHHALVSRSLGDRDRRVQLFAGTRREGGGSQTAAGGNVGIGSPHRSACPRRCPNHAEDGQQDLKARRDGGTEAPIIAPVTPATMSPATP